MQNSNQETNNQKTPQKAEKTTSLLVLVVIIAVLLFLAAVTAVFVLRNFTNGTKTCEEAVAQYMGQLPMLTCEGGCLSVDQEPMTQEGLKLYNLIKGTWSYEIVGIEQSGGNAVASVNITCPDIGVLKDAVRARTIEELKKDVEAADSTKNIYNEDLSFKTEALNMAYEKALPACCVDCPMITLNARLNLQRHLWLWEVTNGVTIGDTFEQKAQKIKSFAVENIPYISKVYVIPEGSTRGMTPKSENFVETSDPNVIAEILKKPYAVNLINGQDVLWNENLPFLRGTTITCYLDESILMIQWQENEQSMVGTFCEVFVADGSQIRKKIAGDTFGDMNFRTTSDFCLMTNAVLAVGGDFYNHGRACGIVVQDRNIYRYDMSSCDVAYIDTKGDMKFSYRNQFSNEDEAREFVKNNDVIFSLSFGPVLIDNGTDMTPSEYPWGQIADTYARSAIGMLGDRHYFTMNMNCGQGETYGYATLRQAADAMIKRGCIKAYTLDGGQTATTAVNGILKNPVQFGTEKRISDVVYFVSAVPEN